MAAVAAIAKAPQKVTRMVGLTIFAPPARAPIAPSPAKQTSEAPDTVDAVHPAGASKVAIRGSAAPLAKVTADVSAACTGRAMTCSESPSSSLAWVPSASFAIVC
jgi:hypothetical protein